MTWLQGSCQELGGKETHVVFHRELHCFIVDVSKGSCGMATQCQAESAILDPLQFLERSRRVVWEDDCSGIAEEGADEHLKCHE